MPLVARRREPPSRVTVEDVVGLTAIFEKHVNICVWERPEDAALASWLREVCATRDFSSVREAEVGDTALGGLLLPLPEGSGQERLREEVAGLVELYADLFGAERVGLRLNVLEAPMCPRFHVDKVGVRLLCTYVGAGTDYVDEAEVRRARLGVALAAGEEDGAVRPGAGLWRMPTFCVGLLKGEAWPGNEGRGVVHRSPPGSERRMLLSIDLL